MKKTIILILCFVLIIPCFSICTYAEGTQYDLWELAEKRFPFYDDLSATAWYAPSVAYCLESGCIHPVINKSFKPSSALTREDAINLFMSHYVSYKYDHESSEYTDELVYNDIDSIRIIAGEDYLPTDAVFTDVDVSSPYYPAIDLAYKFGLTAGIGNREFGIGKPVTRQDFAVMANKYLNIMIKLHTTTFESQIIHTYELLYNSNNVQNFADKEDISSYAIDALTVFCGAEKMVKKNVKEEKVEYEKDLIPFFVGYNGYLKPLDRITRAEGCTVYYRVSESFWNSDNPFSNSY